MRAVEMTQAQRRIRDALVAGLTRAGWNTSAYPDNATFEQGGFAFHEASLRYKNAAGAVFELHYNADREAIYLTLTPTASLEADLILRCLDRVEQLVCWLSAHQDELGGDSLRAVVRDIVRLCPQTYAAVGEESEEVVQLVTDGGEQ